MVKPCAPVRERHVVVDADEIDIGRRPKGIEIEIDVAGTVTGLVPEILGPIGGVADICVRSEQGPAIVRQRNEPVYGRIASGRTAGLRDPTHFRPDNEGVDASRGGA